MASPKDTTTSHADAPVTGSSSPDKSLLKVKVYSPYQVYFDKAAYSISGVNSTGPFDILPHHHNFMTILLPCELIIRAPEGERHIRIARGIMHVKADEIIVFLDG